VIKSSIEAQGKGWFVGPWNSRVSVAVGYSDRGIDETHSQDEMSEMYLVARGTSTALVDGETVMLQAGDLLVVEPGETHTSFLAPRITSTLSCRRHSFKTTSVPDLIFADPRLASIYDDTDGDSSPAPTS
jgi:glyoxylate utilization-related uncharacterized protein